MYVTVPVRIPTTKKGVIDSPIRIPTNCFPYFLTISILSSAPTKKPINVSDAVEIGLRAATVSFPKTASPETPIMIPMTI